MAIRYKKLWKLLIDKEMMKKDLRDQSGITTNALAKLGKNEHVSTQVLEKICRTLNCNIEDVCEVVKDDKELKYKERGEVMAYVKFAAIGNKNDIGDYYNYVEMVLASLCSNGYIEKYEIYPKMNIRTSFLLR